MEVVVKKKKKGVQYFTQDTEDAIVSPEMQLEELRSQRNLLLMECDWTQLPDVPESTRTAWQTYRQSLRDITNLYSNTNSVIWPTKPT